jgi:hypothetical protein
MRFLAPKQNIPSYLELCSESISIYLEKMLMLFEGVIGIIGEFLYLNMDFF